MVVTVVCMLAGVGAGLGIAFAGLSSAVVTAPVLIGVLGMEPYSAISIALAADVPASAAAGWRLSRGQETPWRGMVGMAVAALAMAVVGSLLAAKSAGGLGAVSMLMAVALGIKFLREAGRPPSKRRQINPRARFWLSILLGGAIGLMAGCLGMGGGLTALLVLTEVLGYPLAQALAPSQWVMAGTAAVGAASHFWLGPQLVQGFEVAPYPLAVCILTTLFTASLAAPLAQTLGQKGLNRFTGWLLLALGMGMLALTYGPALVGL